MAVRFRLLSDLHLEFYTTVDPVASLMERITFTDQDQHSYLILAGDIGYPVRYCKAKPYINGENIMRWHKMQRKKAGTKPNPQYEELLNKLRPKFKGIILVPGNHEYYRCVDNSITMADVDTVLEEMCQRTDVIFLQKRTVTIGQVAVHGCTLFSNVTVDDATKMNDTYIARQEVLVKTYLDHLAWLTTALNVTTNILVEKCLVITHHLPILIASYHTGYCTNVLELLQGSDIPLPDVWSCGHIHMPINKQIDRTCILSAPMGYNIRPQFVTPVYFEL
jgi:hypothetical protein